MITIVFLKIQVISRFSLVLLALLFLNLVLGGCGGLVTPEGATATPRPSPQLATPTVVPFSPTPVITETTRTTLIRSTALRATNTPVAPDSEVSTAPPVSPTRDLLSTATPSPNLLSPTPIALSPPAITATPRPVRAIGGDLISAQEHEAITLQPYGPPDVVSQQYRALLYDAKLLRRNPRTLEWEPNAALAFKYDDSQKAAVFVLRSDIKWSDGQPITAADYLWTYTQALDPGKNWTGAAPFTAAIESYVAPDSHTLLVKLRDRYADPFELANFVEPLPKHIWEGRSWSEANQNSEIFGPTVVSGPWLLKEWVRQERITFVRNEASTISPPPYLNSLTFLYLPDSRKALEMLARGELDFYIPPTDRYLEMNDAAKVITYHWNPAMPEWNYLGFNFRRTLPANPAFRQALASLTDRATLINGPGEGLGTPMYSDVPPGHPTFIENIEKYGGGMEQARLLLKEAGYTWRDTDGHLLDPQGHETPELTLVYNSEGSLRGRMALYFQQRLAELGVSLRLVSFDFLNYVSQLKEPPYDYDLFLGGWQAPSIDLTRFGQVWQNNFSGYNDTKLIELYDKAAHEPDETLRLSLLTEIQSFEASELPYLYLYAEEGYLGALFSVGGITEGSLGPFAQRYTDWYVKN
ncbi:MAG: ABC transporter substrate-binding protein [Chloroflexota bacterium]